MAESPYESSQERPEPTPEQSPGAKPTDRKRFNRIIGLGCYAGALVMFGLLALGVYDELRARGIDGVKKDLYNLGILAGATVILFAIGYTTGRRPRS